MCGSPAVPRTSARASETKLSLLVLLVPYSRPGVTSSLPFALVAPSSSDRLKPYLPRTHSVMRPAPVISSTALMICTQVVPFMPPTRTYTSMMTPTTAMVRFWPPEPSTPSSRLTRPPAPTIWASR
jgi:hypothetical protein